MSQVFDRVLVIFFENENADTVLQNRYFAKLAAQGARLTGYHGVTHPSQPNYIAAIGGDFFDWDSDEITNFDETNLVDLLEAKNVKWGVYMQNLPDNKLACHAPNISGPPLCGQPLYYGKHNPFASFTSSGGSIVNVNLGRSA